MLLSLMTGPDLGFHLFVFEILMPNAVTSFFFHFTRNINLMTLMKDCALRMQAEKLSTKVACHGWSGAAQRPTTRALCDAAHILIRSPFWL